MPADTNNTLPLPPGQRWPFEELEVHPAYPASAFDAALHPLAIDFDNVAFGMMIESVEGDLVQAARHTWMTAVKGITVLLLLDCRCPVAKCRKLTATQPLPAWLSGHSSVTATIKCYYGGPYLPDHNANKGQVLWNELFKLPRRKFYFKLDTDTMLEPSLLLRFINVIHRDVRPKLPQLSIMYFGRSGGWPIDFTKLSDQPWYKNLTVNITSRLNMLSKPDSASSPLSRNGKDKKHLPYVQGGLIGVSYGALQMIVQTQCVDRIANAIPWRLRGIHQPLYMEDFNLGICMHIFGAPTISTPCVHPTLPCKCAAPNATKECREHFWRPGSCLHGSVAIHRLKNATDYRQCWSWQQEQLQPHRETFLRPFSKHFVLKR